MIAEDFEENRTALTLILEYAGFDVIEVENGRQAVEAVRREEPDLVLMDVTLPVVDGLQATREIRSEERFERLPIIILRLTIAMRFAVKPPRREGRSTFVSRSRSRN